MRRDVTQRKRYKIEVRRYPDGKSHYHANQPYEVVETLHRMVRSRQCGNFSPVFCTYKRREYMVFSDLGDLSDPFRSSESYMSQLFIEV